MQSEPVRRKQRFVLIDDDPTYRAIILRAATLENMQIDVFESLMDLGSVALLDRYDAAIIDYDLGAINGVEIAEYLSALFGDIPMILISRQERMPDKNGWPESIKMFVNKAHGYSYALTHALRLATTQPRERGVQRLAL